MCNQVGGDYFDFIHLANGKLAVAIGDVAGHGLGAALLVADARAALRGLLSRGATIEECFFELNNLLQEDTAAEMYMTFLLGVLDGPARRFQFVTAGHHMPIVSRRGKSLKLPLMGSNIPLGIRRDLKFLAEEELELASGDSMLLYTDGVWEATDRENRRFGADRLHAVLAGCAERGGQETIDAMLDAVARHRWAPEAEDDYTLVIAQVD
jgi:sigma-B regulation protein RsbU (phosphoserine phosphatase)